MYQGGGNDGQGSSAQQTWSNGPPRPPAIGNYKGGAPPNFVPAQSTTMQARPPARLDASGYARPPAPGISYGPGTYTGPPPPLNAASGQQAHTTVFVGTISSGVTDAWLTRLLSACGYLRSFKRVSSAFGFAEYADPESVLRTLAVLAGREFPVMGRVAIEKDEPAKKLTVKADEKTRKYLDQYEQGRMRTNEHENNESQAAAAVQSILVQMADPNNAATNETANSYDVPSHLRDLPPEDLPEEHRGTVLSEIDKFRQASAARDDERKRRERVQEMERLRSNSGADRGYQGRSGAGSGSDPQSYQRPVDFVPARQAQEERDLPADERDEREEQRRQQRESQDREHAAHEAEKRFLASERARLAHWSHVLDQERSKEREKASRAATMKRWFESWDQAAEEERDVFYVDRKRWRAMRRSVRQREEEDDEHDRQAEIREAEEARIEAERFLAQQAEHMAAFEREQRAAGVLMPNDGGLHVPLKLKRSAPGAEESSTAQPRISSSVLGNAEDDVELNARRKGRLAHIDVTDEETKRDRFRAALPSSDPELFTMTPIWEKVDDAAVDGRYKSMLDEGIIESLGEAAPDLVEALIETLRKRGSASDMLDVIAPVLEDDADSLIRKLWTEILVDTRFDE